MTKMLDAVKRFELQTQQEISNYKSSHNNILKSIRDLKDRIDEIDHNTTENLASVINDYSIGSTNLMKELNQIKLRLDVLEKSQRDSTAAISVVASEVSGINSRALNLSSSCLKIIDTVNENQRKFAEFSDAIDAVYSDHVMEIARIEDHFKSRLSNLKNEIDSAPSKEKHLYDSLKEKIDCYIVDVQGINKEIRIFKKENMITEKKIEHIYTLIDRIKNKIGVQ